MLLPLIATIMEAADEGFVAFDREGRCLYAGRRLGEIFGVECSALIGGPELDVMKLLASACEDPELLARAPTPVGVDLELKRPCMRVVHWRTCLLGHVSESAGWLGIVRDVTRERSAERRAQQAVSRLASMTVTDALTQVNNSRRFSEELEREHGRAARNWGTYVVLRIDIDGLRSINRDLGEPKGDVVLERVAELLKQSGREYDVLGRLQYDEFVMLLPGADTRAATTVSSRIANTIAKTPLDLGESRTVTVTVGAAVWVPPSAELGVDVVKRAGDALRQAKSRGKGSVLVIEHQSQSS